MEETYKGFSPHDGVFSEEVYEQTVSLYEPLLLDTFATQGINTLIALARYYSSKEIKIVFHEVPRFKMNEFFSKEYLEDYQRGVNRLREAGYIVLDCDLDLGQESYRNINHMNTKGANQYSAYLIDQLGSL